MDGYRRSGGLGMQIREEFVMAVPFGLLFLGGVNLQRVKGSGGFVVLVSGRYYSFLDYSGFNGRDGSLGRVDT